MPPTSASSPSDTGVPVLAAGEDLEARSSGLRDEGREGCGREGGAHGVGEGGGGDRDRDRD